MNSNGTDIVAAAAGLASCMGTTLTADEVTILGAFFTALGDNLAIIAIAKENCKEDPKSLSPLPET